MARPGRAAPAKARAEQAVGRDKMPRLIEAGGGKRLIEAGGGKRDSGRRLIEAGGGRRITAEEAEVEYQVAREEIVPDAPEDSGVGAEDEPVVDQVPRKTLRKRTSTSPRPWPARNTWGKGPMPSASNPEEIEKEEE